MGKVILTLLHPSIPQGGVQDYVSPCFIKVVTGRSIQFTHGNKIITTSLPYIISEELPSDPKPATVPSSGAASK